MFGIYQHSSGPQGGFVVRTLHPTSDGRMAACNPYSHMEPMKEYKTELGAQTFCDKLNSGEITLPVCPLCGTTPDLEGHSLSCPSRWHS